MNDHERKKIMKKKILAALLTSAMILSIAGCDQSAGNANNTGDNGTQAPSNSDNGGSTPAGDSDKVLTILAWSGNSDIQNMKKIFCEATGTSEDLINIVAQGKDGGEASEKYQQYLTGSEDADLMCLEADWILKYINDDTLTAPMSDLDIAESSLANAYKYTVEIGTNESGTFKAASFQATPGGFAYRADLAEQYLGVKSPAEMQEKVKDWDTFEKTAAELKEASGGKCALVSTEGGLWQVYQANRTQAWVVDGKLVMDNAENFFDIAKKYKDEGYLFDAPQWDAAWYASISNGDALGDFATTWSLTTASDSMIAQFNGGKKDDEANMAFCAGPQNYYWGGTWLGVSTRCNTKELAKQFVEFFTCSDENMKKYVEGTNDYCNNSKVMKEISDAGTNKNPYLKDGQDQFAILKDAADGINMTGLITKYDSTIKTCFNDAVQAYIAGTHATKEDAIKAFKTDVAGKLSDITVE